MGCLCHKAACLGSHAVKIGPATELITFSFVTRQNCSRKGVAAELFVSGAARPARSRLCGTPRHIPGHPGKFLQEPCRVLLKAGVAGERWSGSEPTSAASEHNRRFPPALASAESRKPR